MNKFTGSQPTMNSFSWKKDFFERYSNQCVCTLQCVCTGAAYQMSQEKGDISLVSKNLCIPHIFLIEDGIQAMDEIDKLKGKQKGQVMFSHSSVLLQFEDLNRCG